jgi:hypothetical protein
VSVVVVVVDAGVKEDLRREVRLEGGGGRGEEGRGGKKGSRRGRGRDSKKRRDNGGGMEGGWRENRG